MTALREKIIVDTVIKLGWATIQMLQLALVLDDPDADLPTYQATLRLVLRLVEMGELTIDKGVRLDAQRKRARGLDVPPPSRGKEINSPTIIRLGERARLRVFPPVPLDQRRIKTNAQEEMKSAPPRKRAGVRPAPFSTHSAHHRAIANFHLLISCRELGIDFFSHAISEYEIAAGRAYLGGKIVRAEYHLRAGLDGQYSKRPDGFLSADEGENWAVVEVEPTWKNTSRRHEVATLDRTVAVTKNQASICLGVQRYLVANVLLIVHGHPGGPGQMMASLAQVPRRAHRSGEPPIWPVHHLLRVDKRRLGLEAWHIYDWRGLTDATNDPRDGVSEELTIEITRIWPERRRRADSVIIPSPALPPTPSGSPALPPASGGAAEEPAAPRPSTDQSDERSRPGWLFRWLGS